MNTVVRWLSFASFLAAPLAAQNLNAVLGKMDAAAPAFRAVTANTKRVTHTAVINEDTAESGTFQLIKGKTSRDLRVLVELTKPDHRYVAFNDRKVELYNPAAATVQEFDLGKQKGLVDQFLLLGFGASGKDLSKSYDIKYGGDNTVEGQKCSRLELTPKSKDVKEHFTKVELCIAEAGYPVRQKLVEPSGNYSDFTYSNVKLNPDVKPEQLALKLPANVKREFPQR